jgi:hypothetical protein
MFRESDVKSNTTSHPSLDSLYLERVGTLHDSLIAIGIRNKLLSLSSNICHQMKYKSALGRESVEIGNCMINLRKQLA